MEALDLEHDTPSAQAPFSPMLALTQQGEVARMATESGHDTLPEVPAQVGDPKWQHAEEAELGLGGPI
jgi:hypothetical protein